MVFDAIAARFAAPEYNALAADDAPAVCNFALDLLAVQIFFNARIIVRELKSTLELLAEGAEELMGGEKVFTSDLTEQNPGAEHRARRHGMCIWNVNELLTNYFRMNSGSFDHRFT